MDILLALVSIIIGFLGLIWSADKFVLGASTTARNLGVPALVIGLTIVALGTSAPEILTSAAAALKGAPTLAIGNVLGSNIANIGLVLGVTALLFPIVIPISVVKKEMPAMLLVTLACFVVFIDLRVDWVDGVILLSIMGFFSWRLLLAKYHRPSTPLPEEEDVQDYIAEISTAKALAILFMGLVLMILSANILVNGARSVALALGVSELVIGLTIVAIGTSLPELATCITSSIKGHYDLAVGNIIGSNIMNLLLVLPVPAFLSPVGINRQLLVRDYGSMLLMSLAFAVAVGLLSRRGQHLGRFTGAVFLLGYLTYTGLLYVHNQAP